MTRYRLSFCCYLLAVACAAATSNAATSEVREPVNAISMARLERLRPIPEIASTRDGERHALRHAAQLLAAARRAAVRQVPARLGRPQAAASRAARAGGVPGGSDIAARIRACESGNRNVSNPRSTASGYYQFINATWRSVTGLEPPAMAYPFEVQHAAFLKLWDGGRGWRHWSASRRCWG